MDEVKKFLSILRRHTLSLIVVPVVSIIITFFLVRNLPDAYVSQAQIATGIVDGTKRYEQQSISNQGALQMSQVNQEFSNLISTMQLKKVLDQVSYSLMIHDLKDQVPFKKPSKFLKDLNKSARNHALEVYEKLHAKMSPLNLYSPDEHGLYELLRSMGYDNESLTRKLAIFRNGDSDFITIQFESEDPTLSAFVVNSLSSEFVNYYSTMVKTNQMKATNLLGYLLKEKSDTLTKKMSELRNYKIKNRVLNLDEQSKQLYSNIIEYDTKKQDAIQTTSSYAGALDEIDRKFSSDERAYLEATLSKVNKNIVRTKDELTALYDLYYENEFDEKYKTSIDSLQRKLSEEISESSDQYLASPLALKEALVQQKLELEVKMDISRYSLNSLERKLDELNAQFGQLVPREAEVQTYNLNIEIATKEYLDILNRYNQSNLESNISITLKIVQGGVPGLALPSKKMILVILSGIISGFFVLLVLFVLYLLDNSITSAEELANKTDSPVMGAISLIKSIPVDFRSIWKGEGLSPAELQLKNQLRSIRYEIEKDLRGKVLGLTSLIEGQGKTFLTMNLAFAWMMTDKRVLIIDGNFKNPSLSKNSNSELFLEDYFQGRLTSLENHQDADIVILKNRGGDSSLNEIASYEEINQKLNLAKEHFDLIIIDLASIDIVSQSKEWMTYSDGIVGVFKFGQGVGKKQNSSLKYLSENGKFIGWIMNEVPVEK
ncbi:MAG: lipopolysaccharide biosynthesis protein [Bacteroidota bacterium]